MIAEPQNGPAPDHQPPREHSEVRKGKLVNNHRFHRCEDGCGPQSACLAERPFKAVVSSSLGGQFVLRSLAGTPATSLRERCTMSALQCSSVARFCPAHPQVIYELRHRSGKHALVTYVQPRQELFYCPYTRPERPKSVRTWESMFPGRYQPEPLSIGFALRHFAPLDPRTAVSDISGVDVVASPLLRS